MNRPNVLLITGDHIRHDALGCNGNTFVSTPNLDRLAESGVTFRNSFTPDPICVPGRAAITTGNYPHICTGNKSNSGRIRDNQIKIAEHFVRNGYRTYALGKLHYVPYAPPGEKRLLHGFQHAELCEEGRILKQFSPEGHTPGLEDYHDYLYTVGYGGYERAHGIGNNDIRPCPSPVPAEHYVDRWVADRTCSAVERHCETGTDPFFIWMSFPKPHSPYDPPEPYHRMYDPRDIPDPLGTGEEADGLDARSPQLTIERARLGFGYLSPEGVRLARAHYYGMVTFQDKCIGNVIELLEQKGIRDNTVIVYTGDHGDLLGDFSCFYKGNFLNGSVRIPSVWSLPGVIPSESRPDALMGLQDVLPTLAALTDTQLGQNVQGMNLLPCVDGDADNEREVYIGQCFSASSRKQQYMACTKKYKYIYSEMNGMEELYDIENDPDELKNRAEEKPDITAELRTFVIQWCKENGDHEMLEGDDLRRYDADVEGLCEFRHGGMGWRWY